MTSRGAVVGAGVRWTVSRAPVFSVNLRGGSMTTTTPTGPWLPADVWGVQSPQSQNDFVASLRFALAEF